MLTLEQWIQEWVRANENTLEFKMMESTFNYKIGTPALRTAYQQYFDQHSLFVFKETDDMTKQRLAEEALNKEKIKKAQEERATIKAAQEKALVEGWLNHPDEWTYDQRHRYMQDWRDNNTLSREEMYTRLMRNTAEPWVKYNNYIRELPPKPDDKDEYAVELYYVQTLPLTGAIWRWFTDSRISQLKKLGSLTYQFSYSYTVAAEKILDDGKKLVKEGYKEVKNDFNFTTPLYVTGAVVGLVAIASILK